MIKVISGQFRFQFVSHFFFSLVALGIDMGLLALLKEGAGLNYLLAAFISYTLGMFAMYFFCVRFIFAVTEKNKTPFDALTFFVMGSMGLGILQIIMYIMTSWLHIPYFISKIAATGFVYMWNFLSRKYFLFRTPKLPILENSPK